MTLAAQAEDFVLKLLKDNLSASYVYHNLTHTKNVVEKTRELINAAGVSQEEADALLLAAWFHDTGYTGGPEDHEHRSVSIFRDFASGKLPDEKIEEIEKLILATDLKRQPKDFLQMLMRDADCAHFGSPNFTEISERLRREFELTLGKKMTDLQWLEGNRLAFTTWHEFQTPQAIEKWQPQKEKNLEEINQKIKKMSKEDKPDNSEKPKKKNKGERGIETLFRVTLNNHTQLSQIADSKANILLSVNAIIISIALSTLIPKLDSPSNAHLVAPTFIMVLFSVVSIVFAILSTRPKVHRYKFRESDLSERKINLLFFGNFNQIPMDSYVSAMENLMRDPDYLYQSLIKDLYHLGKVLDRKYRLLRITYNIFMFGIVISVLAFAIAFCRL